MTRLFSLLFYFLPLLLGTALAQSGKDVKSVIGTMFAAVTFHELFKSAAVKAVKQLDKDQWSKLLSQMGDKDKELLDIETLK